MKRYLALALVLLMVLAALAACKPAESTTSESAQTAQVSSDTSASTETGTTETKKWKIAMSNSFVGNDWRQEMQKIAEYVAESDAWKDRVTLDIVNCENTAEAQSASIDALILEGYDAILIDASSSTALNPVCQRALDAGIVIVAFDQIVTAEGVVKYGCPFGDTAEEAAKYLVTVLGGKGNIVVDRGLAGASGSIPLYDRAKAVFDQYPDIQIVAEFDSNYAEGDTLAGMQAAIAANPVIDGVYTQSYAAPVIQALNEAERPMVPVVSWSYNSSFKAMAENDCDGCVIHNGPGIGAEAMVIAVNILEGTQTYPTDEEIDANWYLYVANGDTAAAADLSCQYEVIEEGVNWWSDLAPGLQNPNVADWVGVTVPIDAIS